MFALAVDPMLRLLPVGESWCGVKEMGDVGGARGRGMCWGEVRKACSRGEGRRVMRGERVRVSSESW